MRERLGGARVGLLCTVRPDGSPHAVPFCFALDRDQVYSAVDAKPKSTAALARLENVRHEPRVAILVDAWSEDWSRLWWIRVDGRARVLEPGPEAGAALSLLAAKYEQYRAARPTGPVIAVTPDRWRSWAATAW